MTAHAEGSLWRGVSIVWLRRFLKKRTRESVHGHWLFVRQELKRITRHEKNWARFDNHIGLEDVFVEWTCCVVKFVMTLSSSCSWTSSINHKLYLPCFCSSWWLSSICWFLICPKFWSKPFLFNCFQLKHVPMSTSSNCEYRWDGSSSFIGWFRSSHSFRVHFHRTNATRLTVTAAF